MQNISREIFQDHLLLIRLLSSDDSIHDQISGMAELCLEALKTGHKILFCGNGGSAADAQHIAAELSGKFNRDRDPLYAEALHVNTSYLTAVANDYGFEYAYSRLIKAKANSGDILIGLSTSGNSSNVINAFLQAREQGVFSIAWTGKSGGQLASCSDQIIKVPSDDTARIQEAHILIGHIVCELIERNLFE